MTLAPGEDDVLTKIEVDGVVSLYVEAKPEPPWEAWVVVDGERERARRRAGSIEEGMVVVRRCIVGD